MSNKIKLLLFVICSVVVAALSVILESAAMRFIAANPIIAVVILVAFPALLYAIFYEKFDFCRSRFASVFFHSMIWLVIIELSMLLLYLFNDPAEEAKGLLKLEDTLIVGLCYWALWLFISLILIAIKKTILRKTGRTESDRMAKEIMQRNIESNFKEKNDV